MQAIHNEAEANQAELVLFQRAKIQDKCKQFTTEKDYIDKIFSCFKEQRYKINASNSQQETGEAYPSVCCFKEQRYKINASNSQPVTLGVTLKNSCFKEQRYKINASNSQRCFCWFRFTWWLFQRAKIQDKCKQFTLSIIYIQRLAPRK